MSDTASTTSVALTLTPDDVLALVRLIEAARGAYHLVQEDTDLAVDAGTDDEAADAIARAGGFLAAIHAAERALGLPAHRGWDRHVAGDAQSVPPPSDGWEGDRDLDGAPLRWENHYECDCGEKWEDIWSCACNDRCPACDTECQPVHCVDLMGDAPADQS